MNPSTAQSRVVVDELIRGGVREVVLCPGSRNAPLAFALSEGSEQRAPMGQAVIGGVITSSLLTLVVVPVIYCYLDDLSNWARARWQRGAPVRRP